jgi:signal transduction histidine kinase/DNA-binding response OmpR family regulator
MGIAVRKFEKKPAVRGWEANLSKRCITLYSGIVLLGCGISALVLGAVYFWMTRDAGADTQAISTTLYTVFYATLILALIAAWPLLMVIENIRTARRAIQDQAEILTQEMKARERTDRELQHAKETADSRNAAKSKYVRAMSHELRTPLNAVLGYAQLLENNVSVPDHLKHSIRVIRRSGDHLSSLVDGLLDISMIEAGRLPVRKEDIHLRDFLRQIVDMMSLQAREAGLRFSYKAAPNIPELTRSDEKKLRQILINLLSNAIRYTDNGDILLSVSYSGQVARFDIVDTGIGIAEADLARIFMPFERVEHADRPKKAGSGLGLTITRHLTEALGGELTVTSVPDQGSKFSVRLFLPPVANERLLASKQNQVITGYEGRRQTVLVIDDDIHQIHFMREMLSNLGFLVLTETSAKAGLERALQSTPDVILLDISMPEMNGWEVARQVRESATRRIPIIILSAHVVEDQEISAAAEIHDAHLMKPVRLERLFESMHKLMNLKWIYTAPEKPLQSFNLQEITGDIPGAEALAALRQLGQIGHLRGILSKLDEIAHQQPNAAASLNYLRKLAQDCDIAAYRNAIETLNHASR